MKWVGAFLGLAAVGGLALCVGASCTAGDGSSSGDANNDGTKGTGASGQGGDGFGGFEGTGGSDGGSNGCAETSATAEEGVAPADIIIAVDTSGSMDTEAQWTQDNMNVMVNAIVMSGVDAHVVMISSNDICVPAPLGSGSCPADENLPAYRHVQQGVGSSDAFEKILQTYDSWKDSLRPGASKTFVVISDDDSDMGWQTFQANLVALDATLAGFKFDAIVASQEPFANPCLFLSAAKGQEYIDLVAATMGVYGDLCLQNFGPVFQDIATSVVASSQVPCVYDIPPPDGGGEIDFGKVNVAFTPDGGSSQEILYVANPADCGPSGGWYYDDPVMPTQILLCDATCNAVQSVDGEMNVKFGCETKIQ